MVWKVVYWKFLERSISIQFNGWLVASKYFLFLLLRGHKRRRMLHNHNLLFALLYGLIALESFDQLLDVQARVNLLSSHVSSNVQVEACTMLCWAQVAVLQY